MSKLTDRIAAEFTGRRRAAAEPLPTVMVDYGHEPSFRTVRTQDRFLFKTTFCRELWIDSNARPEVIAQAKQHAILAVSDDIYGEFRRPLRDAMCEIEYGDPKKARELIDAVLKSMFEHDL
jgi:hypothetical protein